MAIILQTNIKDIPTLYKCLKHLDAKGLIGLHFSKQDDCYEIAIDDFDFEVTNMAEIDKGQFLEKFNLMLKEVSPETKVIANKRVAFLSGQTQTFLELRLQIIKNSMQHKPQVLTEIYQDLLVALKNTTNKYQMAYDNWIKCNQPLAKPKDPFSQGTSFPFKPIINRNFQAHQFSPTSSVNQPSRYPGASYMPGFFEQDFESKQHDQIAIQNRQVMFDSEKEYKKRECDKNIAGIHSKLTSAFEKMLVDSSKNPINLDTLNLNVFSCFNFNSFPVETYSIVIAETESDSEKSMERVVIKIQSKPGKSHFITDDVRENYYAHMKLFIAELQSVLQRHSLPYEVQFDANSCTNTVLMLPRLVVTKASYKNFEMDIQRALLRAGLMNDYHLDSISHYRTARSLHIETLKAKLAMEYMNNEPFDANLALRHAASLNHLDNLLEIVKVLKADVDAQGLKSKKTALHWAVEKGHVSCVRALLEAGASTNLPDSEGITAKALADRSDNEELRSLFAKSVASVSRQ